MGSIRLLQEVDDRSQFHSGDASLDRYFQVYAGQNQFRHHLSITYVFDEAGELLGYVTVSGGEMKAERLPKGSRKLPAYPLPILRVARLAVIVSAKGKGIGAQLLRHALNLALSKSSATGCVGVLVDPKPGLEGFYERFAFQPTPVIEGQILAPSPYVPYFISVQKIRAALAAP